MGDYKHIETCIGNYIATHYTNAVEIGIGESTGAAQIIHDAKKSIRCTDIKNTPPGSALSFAVDDIFEPVVDLYAGADVIYAIRPAVEMIPPMISLAQHINADLLVYHLGFEVYGNGGQTLDCGVVLHRYHSRQNPSKRVT
jgi:uncharacterized UPF0146 family protein